MCEKITLPGDPREAIHETASYLSSLSMAEFRSVRDCDGQVIGYYQNTEWLNGLNDIASELRRIEKDIDSREADSMIDIRERFEIEYAGNADEEYCERIFEKNAEGNYKWMQTYQAWVWYHKGAMSVMR